jgi:two-component system, OmpR family, heavy metal sensor histidine kinase CusS
VKSIRLSLMAYFLVLLALALGTVSLLVYEISAKTLRQKQETYRQLLRAQSHDLRSEKTAQLDDALLSRARALANLAQAQVMGNRLYELRFLPLVVLAATERSQSQLLEPLWLYTDVRYALSTNIQLNEDLLHTGEDHATDLFQINTRSGGEWQSRSLNRRSLLYDSKIFANMEMFRWDYEDIDRDGTRYRLIRLKVPIVHYSSIFPGGRRPGGTGGGTRRDMRSAQSQSTSGQPSSSSTPPPSPPSPPQPRTSNASPFFIQYATDRTDFDRELVKLNEDFADQLRVSEEESQSVLDQLRRRLWWIAIATFGGVGIGAFLLVGFGLAPLRRLSDAVSRVSETNFNLEYDGPAPPTELMPIVDRLRDSLAMLQKAFDREKQATADISHELRTPLAGLMTTVDVALRKPRSPEEYRESLQDCRDIIRQMTQMVERLLTLTWLDARSDRVKNEPVDVGMLANQCAAVVRPLAKARGLTLNVFADASAIVRADPDKLREVMSNLLHNAVEYNRPDGSIDLRVRSSKSGLDVEVRDTGIGISAENRERIFERFFRADESRQEAGLHAGLGLAIVRGYVDLMGGTISVESELGRGSAFRVHIPAPLA